MRSVIQRVAEASVSIDGELYSKIDKGLLILLGVCRGDNSGIARSLAKKFIELRIFSDDDGKMNHSVKDINGEILIISQFTLCSDKGKSGNRPGFSDAESPEAAYALYEEVISEMKEHYNESKIKTGVFAADMKVSLLNDGPVTILLDK